MSAKKEAESLWYRICQGVDAVETIAVALQRARDAALEELLEDFRTDIDRTLWDLNYLEIVVQEIKEKQV